MHKRWLLRNGGCEREYQSGGLTRESIWKDPVAEWPVFMTPEGLRTYEPRGASSPVGGSNRKREELDEERKGGRGGCRSWTAKVQRVELVRNGEHLHQLKELSLKGGTRLFGGGDPKCVSWKGTAAT